MPQTILELLLHSIREYREQIPELVQTLEEIKTADLELMKKPELSEDDLTRLKDAYGAVKTMTTDMIKNPENLPEEIKALIPAFKAIQEPLDCYIKDFNENPKTLDSVLSDPSWIRDYIRKPKAVQEDPEYVPDSYKPEFKGLGEARDVYVAAALEAKEGFRKHLVTITGDAEQPMEVLNQKLIIMAHVISKYGKQKDPVFYPKSARKAYSTLAHTFEIENTQSLSARYMHVLDHRFFGILSGRLYKDYSHDGTIERMEGPVSPELRENLLIQMDNLIPKRKYYGITRRTEDILHESSGSIAMFDYTMDTMLENIPHFGNENPLEDPDHPAHDIYMGLKAQSANMADLITGKPGAKVPAWEDLKPLTDMMVEHVKNQDIFDESGTYKAYLSALEFFTRYMSGLYPEMEQANAEIFQTLNAKGQIKFRDLTEELAAHPDAERQNQILISMHSLQGKGFVTRDTVDRARWYAMAGNPDFCRWEITRVKNDMRNMVENGHANDFWVMNTDSDFFGTKTMYDDGFIKRELCKIFVIGKIIEREQAAGLKPGNLDEYIQRFNDIDNNPVLKHIYNTSAPDLEKAMDDEGVVNRIMDALFEHKNDLLAGADPRTLANLTQSSGNMWASNSGEYSAISESIANIQLKNKGFVGADSKDYADLVIKCSDYMTVRSSEAGSINGRKRFAAAAEILRTVGPKAALAASSEDRHRIYNGMVLNMFRSKDFREDCIEDAKARILAAFCGEDKISAENLGRLSEEQQKSIAQDVKLLTAARVVEDSLDSVHRDQIITEKNADEAELARFRTVADRVLDQRRLEAKYQEDPALILKALVRGERQAAPERAPEAGPAGI